MKKKLLGFLLAICLFFPLTTMLTACGPDEPDCEHTWTIIREPTTESKGEASCSGICQDTIEFPKLNDTDYEVTNTNPDYIIYTFTKNNSTFRFYQTNFQLERLTSDGYHIVGYTGSNSSITIPKTMKNEYVVGIADEAFQNNTTLTSITLPDRLKTIGSNAFKGCTSLSTITFNDKLEQIGNNAFYGCTSLNTITLPESLLNIGSYTFAESGLTEITIPNSVTQINTNAFENCTSLQKATLGTGLEIISDYTFKGCTDLEEIVLTNSITEIRNYSFANCTSLEELVLPSEIERMYPQAFDNCTNIATIWYKGTISTWSYDDVFNSEIDIYYYCENEPTPYVCVYEIGSTNLWHYNTDEEKVIWQINITNNAKEKTYNYSETQATITDEYWTMLQEAKAQGVLGELFNNDQDQIDKVTSSTTKAEYETKLSTMDMGFYGFEFNDNGYILVGSGWMPYQEIDNVVCVMGHLYIQTLTFNQDMSELYYEISSEGKTIKHTYTLYVPEY